MYLKRRNNLETKQLKLARQKKRTNGIFIENGITYIPGSKLDKKKKKKQAKLWEGVQTSKEGAGGEEGEQALAGVFDSPEQSAEKDPSASLSLGISK